MPSLQRLIRRPAAHLAYAIAPRATAAWVFMRRLRTGLLEPEIALAPALCDPEQVALDVGANAGFYTQSLARRVQSVIAIEPIPELAGRLRRRVPVNAQVIACALSDRSGTASLRVPADLGRSTLEVSNLLVDCRSTTRTIEVPVSRLDDLPINGHLGFVKIDVEGHELAVCRGGAQRLRADRPNLLIEAEERHRPRAVADLAAFLATLSYAGFFRDGDDLAPLERFDPARHQRVDAVGKPASEGYIHNFLFVPQEVQGSALTKARAALRVRR